MGVLGLGVLGEFFGAGVGLSGSFVVVVCQVFLDFYGI